MDEDAVQKIKLYQPRFMRGYHARLWCLHILEAMHVGPRRFFSLENVALSEQILRFHKLHGPEDGENRLWSPPSKKAHHDMLPDGAFSLTEHAARWLVPLYVLRYGEGDSNQLRDALGLSESQWSNISCQLSDPKVLGIYALDVTITRGIRHFRPRQEQREELSEMWGDRIFDMIGREAPGAKEDIFSICGIAPQV
jgi:hypothetical protein